MCVNCNLATPLADWMADKLGVERRKYLVHGHLTYKYMTDEDRDNKRFGFVNDIINFKTWRCFETVGDYTKDFIVTEDGVKLYELKYKQIKPLHREYIADENSYRELFIGDTFDYIAEPLETLLPPKSSEEKILEQIEIQMKLWDARNAAKSLANDGATS